MDIGIVVHSQTGNTLSVAERLKERMTSIGHTVSLERIEPEGEVKPRDKDVKLKVTPDASVHEALVLGAPVHAFALSPVMQAYLREVPSLAGMRVGCLVTMQLPFAWMGGANALRQMRKLCEAKGAEVRGTGVVNWSRREREAQISELVEMLSDRITA